MEVGRVVEKNSTALGSGSTRWLDLLKSVAVLWIFLNHVIERILGGPYAANPAANWPPFNERLSQLAPISDGNVVADVVLNGLRYLGWAGDQGVQLFLIASGFGLTWSVLKRGRQLDSADFFRKRVLRILPLWWGAHFFFLAVSVFVGKGLDPFDPRFILSLAGFRATPDTIYYFSPAWWYIGLILQLYVIFPWLFRWLEKWGPWKFLVTALGMSFAIRLVGLMTFDGYLDAWSRGAIFITRLPEFVFGMALAFWMSSSADATDRLLMRRSTVVVSVAAYVFAVWLSLSLWGMTFAPFIQGVAAFLVLYRAFRRFEGAPKWLTAGLLWLGVHSYSVYLVHHPIILFVLDHTEHPSIWAIVLGLALFPVVIGTALALEWFVSMVGKVATRWRNRYGGWGAVVRSVSSLVLIGAIAIGGEVAVRLADPQEVNGWGERPSLEPHPEFGWRLIPDQHTRLRWESYDYVVDANSEGFPGPLYSEARRSGTLRIMTLGDAFTSAEGVDTTQAWPRLLETELRSHHPELVAEVLNFAITGYGPNQYAAVLAEYAPRFRPDVVVVGFFVNEFFDVLTTNDEFKASIGFGSRSPDGVISYLRLAHLRRWAQLHLGYPLRNLFTSGVRSHGYFLGNFRSLEANSETVTGSGYEAVAGRMMEMSDLANSLDAELVVAMVPAPVQVCEPEDLTYFPRNVHLHDPEVFDLDLPQRMTSMMAADLNVRVFDLRVPLEALDTCPYQSRNMHWLEEGHRATAEYLAEELLQNGHTDPPN